MSTVKVGDRVTPENVAGLPIGTVVEWGYGGRTWRATRIEADTWQGSSVEDEWGDDSIADPEATPTIVVSLGAPPVDHASLVANALAIYDAGGSRDEMAAALRGGR